MKKGTKIILLVLYLCVVVGGIAFLGVNIHRQMAQEKKEEKKSEAMNNQTGTDSSSSIETDDDDTGYILIGDSRFVGMDAACEITENPDNREYVVAKVGQGLSWFKEEGLKEAEDIEETHPQITKWKYVICLGVNDLIDIDDYIDEYTLLKNDHDLVLVSVGPVGDSAEVTNEDIQVFNEQLKDFCDEYDIPFIDYNTTLKAEGYETQDGLHYTNTVYERIYELIEEGMKTS